MKNSCPVAVLLVLFASVASVHAFGDEGHRVIGAMADRLIAGTKAGRHVRELLGDETLSTASVWADQVKGRVGLTPEMIQFKTDNPDHALFHFTDIPFEETKYRDNSIGASSNDVVHAIVACIQILQGKPESQTVFVNVGPRVALRLVAHYIEDIHQPLHVGSGHIENTHFTNPNDRPGHFGDDQGGNRLVFGGTNRLHFYWDTTVVQLNMAREHVENAQQYAATLMARPAPDWKTASPLLEWDRVWADESLALARKARDLKVLYEDDTQRDYRTQRPRPVWHIQELPPEYVAWSCKVAEDQMTKAGYRLAATLEAIWR